MKAGLLDLIADRVAEKILNPGGGPGAAPGAAPPEEEQPPAGEPESFSLTDHRVTAASAEPPKQWAVHQYGVRALWEKLGTAGEGARVAVIDTGVNSGHPDLAHVKAHDYTGDGPADANGHGSHCCGIVGAPKDGGVFGVSPGCELHSFRVFDNKGSCKTAWIIAALRDIRDGKMGRFDVVSMSLGSSHPSEEMRMLLLEMSARGALVVVAAGNDGSHVLTPHRRFGTVGFPAGFLSTIAVGSTDRDRNRSRYSSTGNKLVVTAPGEDITNCWIGSDGGKPSYATISGTSMACPFVAGCLALLCSYCRSKELRPPTLDTVTYALAASAVDLESAGYDVNTGFGDVDPANLIRTYERLVSTLPA